MSSMIISIINILDTFIKLVLKHQNILFKKDLLNLKNLIK